MSFREISLVAGEKESERERGRAEGNERDTAFSGEKGREMLVSLLADINCFVCLWTRVRFVRMACF